MKNNITIALITVISIMAGYLLSGISLVGRIGIGLFYHQYHFLKVWWQGALLVFIVWLLVWFGQVLLRKKISNLACHIMHLIFLLTAVAGLYFSYADFRHTLSHRWLGERFHLGVYLFWLGWISLTIYVWLMPYVAKKDMMDDAPAVNI